MTDPTIPLNCPKCDLRLRYREVLPMISISPPALESPVLAQQRRLVQTKGVNDISCEISKSNATDIDGRT
jgi:hypothetical protein